MEFLEIQNDFDIDKLSIDSLIWSNKKIQQQQDKQGSLYDAKGSYGDWNRSSMEINNNKHNKKSHDDRKNIFSYIKPDYGSLGQFISDINLNADFLKQKKKKNDIQQQLQQKKLRQYLMNKNLNKVITNPQSSTLQRNIACKLMIQKSFQQAFGQSITQFYQEQNLKLQAQQSNNKKLININSLSDALDQIVNNSKQQEKNKPNNSFLYIKQNLRKNRSFLRDNTFSMSQKENQLNRLINAKNAYRSLNKYVIPQIPNNEYKQLTAKYSHIASQKQKPSTKFSHTTNRYSHTNRESSYSSSQSNYLQTIFKTFQTKHFKFTNNQIIINNLYQIQTQTVLWGLKNIQFQSIQYFSVINTMFVSADVLFLILDLLISQSKKLKVFVLEDIQIMINSKNLEKLCMKIKSILQKSSQTLQVLRLNKINLQTKEFCLLCLGIGSTKKLELIEMKNNKIDQHGKKSYEVITKFFKNVQFNLQGNLLYNQIMKIKAKSNKAIS